MEGQPVPPPPGVVPPPEALHVPEVKNSTVVDRVRFTHRPATGDIDQTQAEETLAGRTPEDVVKTATNTVDKFTLFKVVEATAIVDGQEVKMTSEPFGEFGTYYVDGSVATYTRAQVESLHLSPKLLEEIPQDSTEIKLVTTKWGRPEIFREGDTIVSSANTK